MLLKRTSAYSRVLLLLYILNLSVLVTLPALAQTFRGQVRGLVSEASGAVIPNATVTLANASTGVTTTKQTDSAGVYIFDFIDPGTFTVTVEASGFGRYVQSNVVVQSSSQMTVNVALTPGTVQQSITVDATPPAVEFNSSNQELTIDTKMANDTPRIDRNPFKLSMLEPAAVNTRGEMLPYQSWAANSVDLGGGTNLKNNLLVDGNPIGIGHKAGYPPNQDDVQESVVSQNSVDAADGHSAGGTISLTTKAGTNEWHGMVFYLGRYPWLSAVADRTRDVTNAQRQHMFGGTFGNPIIKNKLFNFFSIEDWKINSPYSYTRTVPTALERGGDFSATVDATGAQRIFVTHGHTAPLVQWLTERGLERKTAYEARTSVSTVQSKLEIERHNRHQVRSCPDAPAGWLKSCEGCLFSHWPNYRAFLRIEVKGRIYAYVSSPSLACDGLLRPGDQRRSLHSHHVIRA